MKFLNIFFLFTLIAYLSTVTPIKETNEYPGVATGALHVTTSSTHVASCNNERISFVFKNFIEGCSGWAAKTLNQNQYIIAASPVLRYFNRIETLGRVEGSQFVTTYRVEYTKDGLNWKILGTFSGNSNPASVVSNKFDTPLLALAIRIHPLTWSNYISMKIEVYVTDSSETPVAANSTDRVPAIQNGFAKVFSNNLLNMEHGTHLIRLDYKEPGVQASCVLATPGNYFIVSTGIPQRWVAIATQGRGDAVQYLKTYTVDYTVNGRDWLSVKNGQIFDGNTNNTDIVTYDFDAPIVALSIRVTPREYLGYPCTRMELYYTLG